MFVVALFETYKMLLFNVDGLYSSLLCPEAAGDPFIGDSTKVPYFVHWDIVEWIIVAIKLDQQEDPDINS